MVAAGDGGIHVRHWHVAGIRRILREAGILSAIAIAIAVPVAISIPVTAAVAATVTAPRAAIPSPVATAVTTTTVAITSPRLPTGAATIIATAVASGLRLRRVRFCAGSAGGCVAETGNTSWIE
ncbi:hypothetical protein [Stenotrophomonas maltophilia]|uniref:hypothetical protein n=1 Tax=Stenotrophomonas maltophilia TaxID=40324 RepID=UPI0019552668|nr:hypothetical protein [Stenotrophomonas maltophilia]MCU1095708.1 hypothetical protein [Stenotrophomonas maltophilia]